MASPGATTSPPPSAEIIASNDDLLIEIHLRLPIKSLLRFKSVSKHWLSLISNPQFSLRRSSSTASGLFLQHRRIQPYNFRLISSELHTIGLNSASSVPPFQSIPFSTTANSKSVPKILQSCNGLLLCYANLLPEARSDYFVYNPTTKHYTILPPLPPPDDNPFSLALAFDPSKSPHYKVLCMATYDVVSCRLFSIILYSSDAGVWRSTRVSYRMELYSQLDRGGVFCNGSIYWLNPWGTTWSYFNVAEERLHQMPMPPVPDHLETLDPRLGYLGESRGHLHFVDHIADPEESQLHVLELDGACSKWVVKYRVDVSEVLKAFPGNIPSSITGQRIYKKNYRLSVICVVRCEVEEESYLVMNVPGKIVRFNLASGSFSKVFDFEPFQCLINDDSDAYQYIESLASV